jgi:STE24 endopeptidase
MNIYLVIVLASIIGAYVINSAVSLLNLRALSPELPEEFRDVYDPEQYRKSQDYTRAQTKLNFVSETLGTLLLTAFILLGGFDYADGLARSLGWHPVATGLVFFVILFALNEIVSIPFELYSDFVIEERYDFNRMTPKTFIADKLKSWLLVILIGAPIVALIIFFFRQAGPYAWVWAWAASALFIFGLQYIAPTVILPLFNKFTPLEEGELRDSIEDYADKQGFDLTGIYVMDGSKRSSKSNAFFTGFGSKKRIALFDTLIENHDNDEIVSILAHEVGHSKLGHVKKNIVLLLARLGLLFFLLSWFIDNPGLFEAFSMSNMSVYAGLVFFLLLYTPVNLVLSVFWSALSRKFEYQADRFAAKTTGRRQPMVRALKKLSRDNLSNLTPHPAHVALNYSHPPVLKRIRAIRRLSV